MKLLPTGLELYTLVMVDGTSTWRPAISVMVFVAAVVSVVWLVPAL